jgi:hypothetical protein
MSSSSSSSAARGIVNASRQIAQRKSSKWMKNDTTAIPSYSEFVHKQTVLRQYRAFLKCVKRMNDDEQKQAWEQVRREFRLFQTETDPLAIRMNVQQGKRRLEQVQALVGFRPDDNDLDHPDSWLNIKDDEDPRGRVGDVWPWKR